MILENNKIFEAMSELLRISLGFERSNFDFSLLSDNDWQELMEESFIQTVGLLCFEAISKTETELPPDVYKEWLKKSTYLVGHGANVSNGIKYLTGLMAENGIEYTMLKGAAAAFYYPEPDKRTSGDIDFKVSPENTEKAYKLMLDKRFVPHREKNDIHYTVSKNNVRFELHKVIAGIPEDEIGRPFTEALGNIVDERIYVEVADFYRPSNFHHGLVIFLHTLHHMLSNGIGLRQLCDWACFVRKTAEEEFWEAQLLPLLKKTGTLTFAKGLTEAAVHYLALPRPSWQGQVSSELRDAVLSEMQISGNFGRKRGERHKANIMVVKNSEKLTFFGKIKQLFKTLNQTNKRVYPVLNKAPCLYPFIMVYRVLRFLVLRLLGKRQSLATASREADERNRVFMKFKLYKTDGE